MIHSLRAHQVFRQTVFVVISRLDGLLERLKAKLMGAKEYVVKPFKTQGVCWTGISVQETVLQYLHAIKYTKLPQMYCIMSYHIPQYTRKIDEVYDE